MPVTQKKKTTITIPAGKKEVIFHRTGTVTYIVEKNASLQLFDICTENTKRENFITVLLLGVGAEAKVYGLFFGVNDEVFQGTHVIEHRASHTIGEISTRGVLGGKAKAAYTGRIHIPQGVSGCHGREEAHTLLLSPHVHIDAVPHLEIGNNDVSCSHSVSVTYLDDIKKFYLESRGMTEAEAIKTIVEGHVAYVLKSIPDVKIMERLQKNVRTKLEHL